jgi:hypothetical protein
VISEIFNGNPAENGTGNEHYFSITSMRKLNFRTVYNLGVDHLTKVRSEFCSIGNLSDCLLNLIDPLIEEKF